MMDHIGLFLYEFFAFFLETPCFLLFMGLFSTNFQIVVLDGLFSVDSRYVFDKNI